MKCSEVCPLPSDSGATIIKVNERYDDNVTRLRRERRFPEGFHTSVLLPEYLKNGIQVDKDEKACIDMIDLYKFGRKLYGRKGATGSGLKCRFCKRFNYGSSGDNT